MNRYPVECELRYPALSTHPTRELVLRRVIRRIHDPLKQVLHPVLTLSLRCP